MIKIDDILEEDEQVLIDTKPDALAYAIKKGVPKFIFGLVFTVVPVAFAMVSISTLFHSVYGNSSQGVNPINIVLLFFLIVPIIFIIAGIKAILSPIENYIRAKKMHYYFTDRRIIIIDGILTLKIKSIELSKIINASIKIDLIDKLRNTGTIYFYTIGTLTIANVDGFFNSNIAFVSVKDPLNNFHKIQSILKQKIIIGN